MEARTAAEFSRIVRRDDLAEAPVSLKVAATDSECAGLAQRFGLVRIESFAVAAAVAPLGGGRRFQFRVTFQADVVQSCVVTLDPVSARVEDAITQEVVFAEAPAAGAPDREVDVELDDDPEIVYGDAFDLGEFAAQQLALALDPYPRKPGVAFSGYSDAAGETGPFAGLGKLKETLSKKGSP
jgi:uncharacterized metal-binding protein YceD (DUF177 family)